MKGLISPETTQSMPAVTAWLKNGPQLEDLRRSYDPDSQTSLLDKAIAENVLLQVEHLKQYPSVKAKLEKKELTIHAWVYTFESGNVFTFNNELNDFEPILVEEPDYAITPMPEEPESNMNFVLNCFAISALGLGAVVLLCSLLIANSLLLGVGCGLVGIGAGYLASNNRFFPPQQTTTLPDEHPDLVHQEEKAVCC